MRACLSLLVLLAACGGSDCELSTIAQTLAGDGATDCGSVAVGGDTTAADACVIAAFQAGTPFFAVYELQGIDSAVSAATVSDGTKVMFLVRDSDPSGGSNVGAVVSETVCAEPAVTAGEAGHDVLTCAAEGCTCEENRCGARGACCE